MNSEEKLIEKLNSYKGSDCLNVVIDLLKLRREKHRDKIENTESSEIRGRAKECKDLIRQFS